MTSTLHDDLLVYDGLVLTSGGREELELMRAGGLTGANFTCSVWEGFRPTMERIARWKMSLAKNADIARPVLTAADLRAAKREGRVGVVLGWQNSSAIEDQLPFIQLFHDVGVRVVQLTYNTQNLVGAGCYEERDSGLTGFGREMVDELNRIRMLIDLSHVGPATSEEAIAHSRLPVCYSHVAASALKDHPRNKSDAQLRRIADKGGFVGATFFTSFLRRGAEATLDDFLDVVEHMVGVAGEEHVGFGTDVRRRYESWSVYWEENDPANPPYWTHDKGYARPLASFIQSRYPTGFTDYSSYPAITAAMEARGWTQTRIRRIMGENWFRFLGDVWGG